MPTMSWVSGVRALMAACLLFCIDAQAQTAAPLLNQVHTIAATGQPVPVEETFNITTAGTYQVTLTDLGAQASPSAPLASATLAISSGNAIVGTPIVSTSGATSWNTTFTAQPGTYIIHVVGGPTQTNSVPPEPTPGSGPIGIQVTNTSNNALVATFSDTLAYPAGTGLTNVGSLNDSFSVTAAGSYTVTLTDMQLPAQLTTLTLALTAQGGSSLLASPVTSPGTPVATATVSLQPGTTYRIFAIGQAAGAVNAGLYGVNVSPATGGAPAYSNTIPVGTVASLGTPALPAGNYTLSANDVKYPAALSQLDAAVTVNGQSASQLTASSTGFPFIVPSSSTGATTYQVFALGIPAAGGQGSYSVMLLPASGAPVISVTRAVSDPTSPITAYSYDATNIQAETYALNLADFGYPASFTTITAATVQGGVVLGSPLTSAGTTNVSPAAGTVSLVVFAQAAAPATGTTTTGGLFGIDLEANGAGTPAFQTSQGVGQLFSVQTVTVTTGGKYQVAVTDLAFPASFANLSVIVTQGITKVGSIFSGGTLPFTATSGDYLINFIATPNSTAEAGTYSLVVGAAPPAASVTLQASPTSVASGGTTTLTWSSQNTTSCTASSSPGGVWSGTVAATGSATSAALTATTVFTLTCAGSDGTTPSQSVTITVNPSTSSHNGGGAIGTDLLLALLGVLALRLSMRREGPSC
jgi:hypothetical protein